jgi:hypothetical protein
MVSAIKGLISIHAQVSHMFTEELHVGMVPQTHQGSDQYYWCMSRPPNHIPQHFSPAVTPSEGAGGASQGAQDYGAQHPEQLCGPWSMQGTRGMCHTTAAAVLATHCTGCSRSSFVL